MIPLEIQNKLTAALVAKASAEADAESVKSAEAAVVAATSKRDEAVARSAASREAAATVAGEAVEAIKQTLGLLPTTPPVSPVEATP